MWNSSIQYWRKYLGGYLRLYSLVEGKGKVEGGRSLFDISHNQVVDAGYRFVLFGGECT